MTDTATVTSNTENHSDKLSDAKEIVSKAVTWSAAASAVPLPLVDLVSLAAIQVNMVRDLAHLYGVQARTEAIKAAISALLGTLGPAAVSGTLVGSSLKLIPGGGTLLGTAGMAAAGSAATYGIGRVFISHFENGGSVESLDTGSKADEVKAAVDRATKK